MEVILRLGHKRVRVLLQVENPVFDAFALHGNFTFELDSRRSLKVVLDGFQLGLNLGKIA